MACNLFIFNKMNSRFSLECHLLPYIPGCSPRERRAQPPTEPLGGCDYKPCCWLGSLDRGEVMLSKIQPCTGPPNRMDLRRPSAKRAKHLRWHSNHQPPLHPLQPRSIPCLPSKTHFLSGSPTWVALPFPAPVPPLGTQI